MPIFRVKSVKIYTGQKKFTRAPLVVLVTNMRYGFKGKNSRGRHHLSNSELDFRFSVSNRVSLQSTANFEVLFQVLLLGVVISFVVVVEARDCLLPGSEMVR